jgi:twitching motility protein PilI
MEVEARASAPGLPEQEETAAVWSGLGFRVADFLLLAPLEQVSEVTPFTGVTLVPGAKSWLKGVSNVRGDLYTVTDLSEFLGYGPVQTDARSKLLIINSSGLNSGVLVPEVLGLKHFYEEEKLQDISALSGSIQSFINGGYTQSGVVWRLFDLMQLAESEGFRHVAA